MVSFVVLSFLFSKMPYNCVAANCTNVSSESVTLFAFPKDAGLRAAWVRQVRRTRDCWSGPSEHSRLCSDHFELDQFEVTPSLYRDFGIQYRRKLVLKPGAIPSKFPRHRQPEKATSPVAGAGLESTGPLLDSVDSVSEPQGEFSSQDQKRRRIQTPVGSLHSISITEITCLTILG